MVDTRDIQQLMKGKVNLEVTRSEVSLIETALNFYFHDVSSRLARKDLGDLERASLETTKGELSQLLFWLDHP